MDEAISGVSLDGEFRPRVGPIEFEVLRHRLWQINDEQGRTIINVSGSPVAAEANDFNVGIANGDGEIVCLGAYMGSLILALTSAIKNVYKLLGREGIEDGDMYMTNDPWLGAVHQNDVCLMAPLFWEGKVVCWIGSAIHQVDVGGNVEGSWNPSARNTFQEAPLYAFLKMVRRGKVQPEVLATYTRNSRLPHLVELDIRSQIAGINVVKERLYELICAYGVDAITDVMQDCLDYQEFLLRHKLRQIPDGEWYAEDYLDHDGRDEKLYTVRLKLIKTGGKLIFDYRESDAQAPGFVNCPYTSLAGGIFIALATHLGSDMPWGSGMLRLVTVQSQEGSIVDAKYPAPVSGAPVNAGWTVRNTACLALSKMLSCSERYKDNAMAVWVGSSLVYNVFGTNQYGKPFGTMMLSSTLGGGGARYFGDGYNVSSTIGTTSPTVINVESAELNFPFLYLYRKTATDSGGGGKYRGGVAALSCITPYDVDSLRVFASTQGTTHSSGSGLDGGYPGGGSNMFLKRRTPIMEMICRGEFPGSIAEIPGASQECLPSKYRFAFQSGDVFETVGHGGGGVGDPLERDPQAVLNDVRNGLVSRQYAHDLYGVVVEATSRQVIQEATQSLRNHRKAMRLAAHVMTMPARKELAPVAEKTLRIGGNLYVEKGFVCCRNCGGIISAASDNPKQFCIISESTFKKASPWIALRLQGNNPELALREYMCPQCGQLLFVDERRTSELNHWWDYRLEILKP